MSVAYYAETTGVTREQVEQVVERIAAQLEPAGAAEGGLFNAHGPMGDGGWWSFFLFDTADHFERYYNDIHAPALAEAGLAPVEYRRQEVAWSSLHTLATDVE